VAAFGVTSLMYGLYQIATGRRNKKVVYFMLGLFGLLLLVAKWMK
jgi:hypothetical protein